MLDAIPKSVDISEISVGVTTVAFSKNKPLVNLLNSKGFKEVKTNILGVRFTSDELIDFLKGCNAAIVGLDKIHKELLCQLPEMRVVSKYGVGLDNINLADCRSMNVEVLHTPGVNKRSVAELTLGYMLSLLRNISVTSTKLKQNIWDKDGGSQLTGKTVGIIGVGNIGKDLVSLFKPFNCRILVNDIIQQDAYYRDNNLTEVDKTSIFKEADIITIHTPLTSETANLISRNSLQLMKPSALLINTARGEIVNQTDLKDALANGRIAGAALDVYDKEPPDDFELISLPNLIATPHIGGNSAEAVEAMGISAIDNLINYFRDNANM
jgi:D-3-phosphoglycerate dehydrogenase